MIEVMLKIMTIHGSQLSKLNIGEVQFESTGCED